MTEQFPEALVKQISRLCRDDHMERAGNALVGPSKTGKRTLVVLEHRPNDKDNLPYHVTHFYAGDIIQQDRYGEKIPESGFIKPTEITVYDDAWTQIIPLTVRFDGKGAPKIEALDFTSKPANLDAVTQQEARRRIGFASHPKPECVTAGATLSKSDFPRMFETAREAAKNYIAKLPENQQQLFQKPPQHSTGRKL